MKKGLTLSFGTIALSAFCKLSAQVTVGTDERPIDGALLQLKTEKGVKADGVNSKKGLALPRVGLLANDQLEPCATSSSENKSIHVGLLVYNITEDAGLLLKKGIYVWDGTEWQNIESALAGGRH